MMSHDLAKKLRETADTLESRPDVDLGNSRFQVSFYGEKEKFLNAVRALKPGAKKMDESYVNFEPKGTILNLYINRDSICRRITPQYECEPLLSPSEDEEMEKLAGGN